MVQLVSNTSGTECPECGNYSVFTDNKESKCMMGIEYCHYRSSENPFEIRKKKLIEITKKDSFIQKLKNLCGF